MITRGNSNHHQYYFGAYRHLFLNRPFTDLAKKKKRSYIQNKNCKHVSVQFLNHFHEIQRKTKDDVLHF